MFPVFYLSLLLPELKPKPADPDTESKQSEETTVGPYQPLVVAALAAVVTLVLTPLTPPGVPIPAAAAVALLGLRAPRPRENPTGSRQEIQP